MSTGKTDTKNLRSDSQTGNQILRYLKRDLKLLIIIIGSLIYSQSLFGQCDNDVFLDKCASNLGSYNYIKSFVASNKQKKKPNTEFSYVFSKGSTYIMIACSEYVSQGKMIISLYDRNHTLISSSYDELADKYYEKLVYPCSATGVYYIKTTFADSKSGCGLCILGFDRTN